MAVGDFLTGRRSRPSAPARGGAAEAEGLARGRPVDLLLTEVSLPDATGPALATLLGVGRVLDTSGTDVGVPAPFLVEPFSPGELLEKVKEVFPPAR